MQVYDNTTNSIDYVVFRTAAMLLIVGVPVSLFVLAFPLCCLLYCVHRRKEKRDQLINNYIHVRLKTQLKKNNDFYSA